MDTVTAAIKRVMAPGQSMILLRMLDGMIRFIIGIPAFHQYYRQWKIICQIESKNVAYYLNVL